MRLSSAQPLEEPAPMGVADVQELGERLRASVRTGVQLADDVLDLVLDTMLAGGHLLVEDHPGVGKTQLARSLAASLGGRFSRVQATVDLLPSDIVGTSIWHAETGTFEFRPGPVFANVVLVDELNRATPKTQSGLLEAMQEGQVTVDGATRPIGLPFLVIATQNPTAGYDGTYPLPTAQLDRFLARMSLGYPSEDQELTLLRERPDPVTVAVSSPQELLTAQEAIAGLHTAEAVLRYVVAVLAATRQHPLSAAGASPRAGLQLLRAARAHAALLGRDFVMPDDVQALAQPVLAHRIQPVAAAPDAQAEIVADALATVPAR